MLKILREFFILLFAIVCFTQINAQKPSIQFSEQFIPLSLPKTTLPLINNEALREKELEKRLKGRRNQFATAHEVAIDCHQYGEWSELSDDQLLWQMQFKSKGAYSLNLGFSEFRLPEGATLYILSPVTKKVFGPFTPADNDLHNQYWTPAIQGDELIVQVRLPKNKKNQLQLTLKTINHDFMNIFGRSGSCNLDTECGINDGFDIIEPHRDVIRSVGVLQISGRFECSGFLVNNTRNDRTPLFMTANHCGIDAINAPTVVVYWNHQNSSCRTPDSESSGANGDGALDQFNTGSTFLASSNNRTVSEPPDFTLIQLDDEVNTDFNPYFAGWTRRNPETTSTFCVHHPQTAEKRISFDFDSPVYTTQDSGDTTFIRILDWDIGTTEGGSSGSPLFNDQELVIGHLNGGNAACGNNEWDEYGLFSQAWEGNETPETRLKDWLDPDGLNLMELEGADGAFFVNLSEDLLNICGLDQNQIELNINIAELFASPVSLSIQNEPEGIVTSFSESSIASGGSTTLTIENFNNLATGTYLVQVLADDGTNSAVANININLEDNVPEDIALIEPVSNSVLDNARPIISWTGTAESFDVEISNSSDFSEVVFSDFNLSITQIQTPLLSDNTTFYWRVRGSNNCGLSEWSNSFIFTTAKISCEDKKAADLPLEISTTANDTVRSSIEIEIEGTVLDVIIPNISGTHTWTSDLVMTLISPFGTEVELISNNCSQGINFNIGFNDNGIIHGSVPCPYTDGLEYQPKEALSSFQGENAKGTWTLQIVDEVNLDAGSFDDWSLIVCSDSDKNLSLSFSNSNFMICGEDNISTDITIGPDFDGDVQFSATLPDGLNIGTSFTPMIIQANGSSTLEFSNVQLADPGTYDIIITAQSETNISSSMISMEIIAGPNASALLIPTNESVEIELKSEFNWEASEEATSYRLQIYTEPSLDNEVFSTVTTTNSYTFEEAILGLNTEYFWQVVSISDCGESLSNIFSFRTVLETATFDLGQTTIDIFPNPASDQLFIKLTHPIQDDIALELVNLKGQRIVKQYLNAGTQNINIDMSNLSAGFYLLKINTKEESFTDRIVKM